MVLDRLLSHRITRLSRRRMKLNASMSTTMNERFNVSGALLVKLFGRPAVEQREFSQRAAAVRDTGVQLALLGRILFAALSLVGAVGTAAVYWLGGRAAVTGSLQVGTVVALAAYVTRLYSPLTDLASTRVDVLTALVSFDRVFEVLDAPRAIDDAPGARPLPEPVRGPGRDGRRVLPLPGRVGGVDRLAGGRRAPGLSAEESAPVLQPRVVRGRAGHHDRPGRAVRRGQDHAVDPGFPAVRRHLGRRCASTATTCAT